MTTIPTTKTQSVTGIKPKKPPVQIGGLLLSLLTAPVASVIALVGFNLTVSQAQGRYLFPALPAMALAAVLLYRQIPGWVRAPRLLVPALVGGYALLNLGIVLTVVRPAYGG